MRRRGGNTRGFAMVDALVGLAIAALTLVLLTSASWGLKMASDRQRAFEVTSAGDWLLARRTLLTWASDVTSDGRGRSGGAMIGTATTMRMIVRDRGAAQGYVGEFRVAGTRDTGYTLTAARHDGLNDARVAVDEPRVSTILTSPVPIRFVYLFPQRGGGGNVWRYETGDGDVLPLAIGVEAGDRRQVTARLFPTISQTCFSVLGPGALESNQCAVR
ncbi:MAG: hypothetical protein AAF222_03695 [Pseudomonadota bacterium]